jgi:hypothetical protein
MNPIRVALLVLVLAVVANVVLAATSTVVLAVDGMTCGT